MMHVMLPLPMDRQMPLKTLPPLTSFRAVMKCWIPHTCTNSETILAIIALEQTITKVIVIVIGTIIFTGSPYGSISHTCADHDLIAFALITLPN